MARVKRTRRWPRKARTSARNQTSQLGTGETVLPSIEGKGEEPAPGSGEGDEQTTVASTNVTRKPPKAPWWTWDNELRTLHTRPPWGFRLSRHHYLDSYKNMAAGGSNPRKHYGLLPPNYANTCPGAHAAADALLYFEHRRSDAHRYEKIYGFSPDEILHFYSNGHTELLDIVNQRAKLANQKNGADPDVEKTWGLYCVEVLDHGDVDSYWKAREDPESDTTKAYNAFWEACEGYSEFHESMDDDDDDDDDDHEDCDLDYEDEDYDEDMDEEYDEQQSDECVDEE